MSNKDGYNWRKYGQKRVQGSDYLCSYYRCTFPSCPVKKNVITRRSLDGQITGIVYKGSHSHAMPQKRSTAEQQQLQSGGSEASEHTFGGRSGTTTTVTLPTASASSAASIDMDEVSSSCTGSSTGNDEVDEHEVDSKKWRKGDDSDGGAIGAANTMKRSRRREPRVDVETISDVETLDDGCWWREYGQRPLKGNPNPRIYYKCGAVRGCPARKQVERASHDTRVVITTYEGKHSHDVQEPPVSAYQSSGASAGQEQDDHGFSGLGGAGGSGAVSASDVHDTHEQETAPPAVAGGRKARVEADEPDNSQGSSWDTFATRHYCADES